ncbi:30S ribosomal protein S6 [Candidatus Gottesmanbacteria bacterium RBG_16_52_11]|uniref:Small ribosomal subunit protein bS6 n=1 Tax=Candidatus Gottesmanbacteria bacterium RBG_16_52_11 TaxID=1798374 RepID=A0A1F5YP74_9BACT|nr:MAG: 30S ribosomal protein S6 [Candidatus Gottesmanbacteria bacterium RBG_16_52_11]
MRTYEMVVIMSPDIDAKDDKKHRQLVNKLLGSYAEGIEEFGIIGKKVLGYPIAKQNEGVYVQLKIKSDSVRISEIQKQMKLMPEIIRFMLLNPEA